MFTQMRKVLFGRERDLGFTLVELLIVILIVGILSAVALPLYLGYTHDAHLAEGKALGGSTLTALSGCVQVQGAGGFCRVSDISSRVGVGTNTFTTYDGRWQITQADLTVNSAIPPGLDGVIKVAGIAGNVSGMSLSMFATTTTNGVILRCDPNSSTPPSSSAAGIAC
jgi:type IV pilus assembly protein PilA